MRKTTRKRIFQMMFVLCLSICLCACQTSKADGTVAEQSTPSAAQQDIRLYLPIVTGNDMEQAVFALIYLDEDDNPELVACDQAASKYSVYTINDGAVTCLADGITTVELTYYARKNTLVTFSRWNGGGDEGGYSSAYYPLSQYSQCLTDDCTPSLQRTYQATYDEDGVWTGTGMTSYYQNGQKIDEPAYQQAIAEFDLAQEREVSCFAEEEAYFTKEALVDYLENFDVN